MATTYLRKYGAATTVDFELYLADGTALQAAASHASGDLSIMKDEGNEGTPTNGFTDEGHGYSLALTATEMQAARIVIYVVDQTSPQAWLDKVLIIETYGNASAMHPFDLGTALVFTSGNVNAHIKATDDIDLSATQKASINTEVDNALNTAIPGTPTADSINERVATLDNHVTADYGSTEKAAVDLLDDAAGGLADVHTDVGTVITNLATVDTVVDAIKAITDLLTLSAIADAIHDETVEGAITHRQSMRLILAALTGKLSGGGTATLVFRDANDTKDRVTATVDANQNRTGMVLDAT